MASTNLDEIGVRPLRIPDWSGGINTSKPPTEIEDNEAVDILNLEFDDSGNLATRCGATQLFATTYANRITSLHYFTADSGEVGILFTTANKLYIVETDGTGVTELTGALTLPNDVFWQWRTFQGIAIGVNRATTGDNPVKVTTSAVASALGGSPPKAKYIEVWNSRVWLISASSPNQIRASALGLPEDWTTAGDAGTISIDVDANDGDQITGIWGTRTDLYIFKRKKIYRVVPINPNAAVTLASNLKVEEFAKSIGCVSGYSIQNVLDDVLFLSEQGVASLTLAQIAEDFRTALFSKKVSEIQRTPKTTEEIPAIVIDNATQYLLSIPASISLTAAAQAYVMDYLKIDERIVRWTRFDNLLAGTAYTSWLSSTGKRYAVGAKNGAGTYQIYIYRPRDTAQGFSDQGIAYTKRLTTKAISVNAELIRKHWHKWGFSFDLLTTPVAVAIQYYFDENITKGGSYSFNLTATSTNALWDVGLWDVALWDSAVITPQDIVRKLLSNSSGQRSQNITFVVTNAQDGQGLVIKDFMLLYSILTEKRVSDV